MYITTFPPKTVAHSSALLLNHLFFLINAFRDVSYDKPFITCNKKTILQEKNLIITSK